MNACLPRARVAGRRLLAAVLAPLALLSASAQIPPDPEDDPNDPNAPIPRNAPLPPGPELMDRVRSRLPAEPLDLFARVRAFDTNASARVEFKSVVELRFGQSPPAASYLLADALGTPRERMDLTWTPQGPRYRVRRGAELTPAPEVDVSGPIEGLEFAWSDLSLSFLFWDGAKTVGRERTKMRNCYIVEIPGPPGAKGVAMARLWVDRRESFVLRAMFFDAKGGLLREVEAESVEEINGVWMVKDLEIKSYPSRKKTKIAVDEVRRLEPAPPPAGALPPAAPAPVVEP